MEQALDFIFSTFTAVFDMLKGVVFHVYGYDVSLFWLFLSLSFMGFVFTVLLPFVGRSFGSSGSDAGKQSSERIKE